jgi:hypothetical protein
MAKHLYRGEGAEERPKEDYFKTPDSNDMETRRQIRQIDDMEFKKKHRAKTRKSLGL